MIQNPPLFGVTICPNQLKVLGVLCSLCKVIGDLGFLNYNQIYLLGINKTYSPLYNNYKFPDKVGPPSQISYVKRECRASYSKEEKDKEGHKVHLRKLISSVNHLLQDTDSAENNAELLWRKLKLERKEQIISKLDEEILEEIEDEGEIAYDVETAEEVHSEIAILGIKIEGVLQQISEKGKQEQTTLLALIMPALIPRRPL